MQFFAVKIIVHKDYKGVAKKSAAIPVRKSIVPSATDIIVTKPKSLMTLVYIHRVVEKVLVHGSDFEQALIEKESRNPAFAFLVDHKVQ